MLGYARSGSIGFSRFSILAVCLMLLLATGCESAGQGAVSGGAVGALSGLAIGSLSGNAGAGAAIGAVTGAVGGAVIGDQNRRNREAMDAAAAANAPRPAPAQSTDYKTGGALFGLVGNWNIVGEEISPDGQRTPVTGTAKGSVEETYFLRLDVKFTDPQSNQTVEGTSLIAQEGGNKLTMNNTFSSNPQMVRYKGNVDTTGQAFVFKQTEPRVDSPRNVLLRAAGPDRWTAQVWVNQGGKDQTVETYTFTRAG
jgi:hypothetical protein